ncbi:glycosyltransferase family 4 protein [Rubrolithibacter danxiaensis]|uniref:glycosyltransferase family 4 protein n=1 Tax=Rubrolithibacter danxiaensis TaxID=3390805 RepID=UPI003BF8D176
MRPERKNTLLLNLNAFSQTGGIEKVSRVLAKAFYEMSSSQSCKFRNLSVYDSLSDLGYCPQDVYRGFSGRRFKFILNAVKEGRKADRLVLTHINLALVALIVKLVNPRIKIFLFAHGIEVWRGLSIWKKFLLKKATRIFAVSDYTSGRVLAVYPHLKTKLRVLNNCIDPLFNPPCEFKKPVRLLEKYKINDEKVILTLCRLSYLEQYKGYEKVIKALAGLKNPEFKYLLMGSYDEKEKARIHMLIEQYELEGKVVLTGFISDTELIDHYVLGDLFIMPSKEEGFGLVFIEAAACGLPLIAGNQDGSTDALLNGNLGILVNPASSAEIKAAILHSVYKSENKQAQQKKALGGFNYKDYVYKLNNLLDE